MGVEEQRWRVNAGDSRSGNKVVQAGDAERREKKEKKSEVMLMQRIQNGESINATCSDKAS